MAPPTAPEHARRCSDPKIRGYHHDPIFPHLVPLISPIPFSHHFILFNFYLFYFFVANQTPTVFHINFIHYAISHHDNARQGEGGCEQRRFVSSLPLLPRFSASSLSAGLAASFMSCFHTVNMLDSLSREPHKLFSARIRNIQTNFLESTYIYILRTDPP